MTATLFALRQTKITCEGFAVAFVGKEVITHQDVCDRLDMEAQLLHREISTKDYKRLYIQAANALINEARQRQAPRRLFSMATKFYQTQAVTALTQSEIDKEVKDRMENMAKNNNMSLAEFQKFLGSHYKTFYRRQESMVAFQRFLMVKWGARAMRNIVDKAIAKARKKWLAMRGADRYRVSEIVIYNRSGQGLEYDQIKEIQGLLANGEPFADLANRSSDAHTSEMGGDCGWQVLSYFDRPIRDFLTHASVGDISPIIALPTERNPEKWVIVLWMDQRSAKEAKAAGVLEKDPGDEVFRNNLFALELERLSKEEMQDLKRSFPCVLNIPKTVLMPPASAPVATSTTG
jgi:hypothetical protein